MSSSEGNVASAVRSTGLQSLAGLPSVARMSEALHLLAQDYGEVRSVSSLLGAAESGHDKLYFLVDFERSADALAASRGLPGFLFGFSTLLVTLPRIVGD
jgi:hypothetical protein